MQAINVERLNQLVRGLGLPVPFDLERFGGWLEDRTKRRTQLVPVIMEPGGPTGALIRRGEEDCLYYEEQTSWFHQAHIVLCLAARLLLPHDGVNSLPTVDGVNPRLVRLMLGDAAGATLSRGEAEAFAFVVMDQARPVCPPLVARRAFRQLQPLRMGVGEAVKEIHDPSVDGLGSSRYRLYRQIVGIRDAALAIKGYRDLQAASAGTATAQAAGLTGGALAAAVEAAALVSAVRAKANGQKARAEAGSVGLPGLGGSDLRGEASWLVKVARAFSRLQPGPGGAAGRPLENSGGSAGTQETWLPKPGVILLRC
jgi:hypothetical protein